MSFRGALERLRAYPPRQLGEMYYERDGLHCALGVLAPSTRGLGTRGIGSLFDVSPEVRSELLGLGLTRRDAEALQTTNDRVDGGDPESNARRYARVVEFLENRVAQETN